MKYESSCHSNYINVLPVRTLSITFQPNKQMPKTQEKMKELLSPFLILFFHNGIDYRGRRTVWHTHWILLPLLFPTKLVLFMWTSIFIYHPAQFSHKKEEPSWVLFRLKKHMKPPYNIMDVFTIVVLMINLFEYCSFIQEWLNFYPKKHWFIDITDTFEGYMQRYLCYL